MNSRIVRATCLIASVACVPAISPAQANFASWLEEAKPASWNTPNPQIPTAPRVPASSDPRCRTQARPAELPEDKLLQAKGWDLVGAYQGGWRTVVILATAGYDGMCRPLQYQDFVFVRDAFAGTLSPHLMNSRSDGALDQVSLQSGNLLTADYARYGGSDPLCCPSRKTSVQFAIGNEAAEVLRPVFASTSSIASTASTAGSGSQSSQSPSASSDLAGKTWQLVAFQGMDDRTLVPDDKSKYTVSFASTGAASVRIDCNRGHGKWKSSGPNNLEFGPLALTRAMCPPAPLNDRLAKDWQYVRSYIMKDGHLFLALMADGGIYEFEPMTSAAKSTASVQGTAVYRERMALPPNAVLVARLEDVSRADAPAELIGKTENDHPGNPPIAFEIGYDPSRIDPRHSYVVRASILVDEKPLFITTQSYAVLTAGHGNSVQLLLHRASSAAAGAVPREAQPRVSANTATDPLENTYWKLTSLGNEPITAASQQQEPHFVLDPQTKHVTGAGGCNRITGSYKLDGDQLTFTQMASTMMACIQGMDTEKTFLDALGQVTKWKTTGHTLELFDASGNTIARFESQEIK